MIDVNVNPLSRVSAKVSPAGNKEDALDVGVDAKGTGSVRTAPKSANCCTRVLYSKVFPPLGDLAQDRIHSRWLSAFLFCIVITYLYRAVFFAIFLTLELEPALPALTPATSLLGQLSAAGVQVGVVLTPVTSVQLRAPDSGLPMASESVQLTFSAATPVTTDYAARFGYVDTLYDYTGGPAAKGLVPAIATLPTVVTRVKGNASGRV